MRPAASNFSFSPPPGVKIKTATLLPSGWSGQAPLSRKAPAVKPKVDGPGLADRGRAARLGAVRDGRRGGIRRRRRGIGGAVRRGSSPGGSSGGISGSALFGAAMRSATSVHGAWGSGRLLHTSLLSILITNDGRVLVGAVTPSVLYADAARAS